MWVWMTHYISRYQIARTDTTEDMPGSRMNWKFWYYALDDGLVVISGRWSALDLVVLETVSGAGRDHVTKPWIRTYSKNIIAQQQLLFECSVLPRMLSRTTKFSMWVRQEDPSIFITHNSGTALIADTRMCHALIYWAWRPCVLYKGINLIYCKGITIRSSHGTPHCTYHRHIFGRYHEMIHNFLLWIGTWVCLHFCQPWHCMLIVVAVFVPNTDS